MHIIELEDQDFPVLLDAFKSAQCVGQYLKNNRAHLVKVVDLFVMVADPERPQRIAIRPARGLDEARELALELLAHEAACGSRVTVDFDTSSIESA